MPIIDGWDLPEFRSDMRATGYAGTPRVRFEEPVPKRCDYSLTNAEAAAKDGGKKPHNWLHFSALFPHSGFPHEEPIEPERIPPWAWCNFCGCVDKTIAICEGYVSNSFGGGASCYNKAVMQADVDRYGQKMPRPKWFCRVHDPIKIRARRLAQNAKWDAEFKARQEAWRRQEEETERRNELVELALETKKWMDASKIYEDDEWAGTIYRKFKKVEDNEQKGKFQHDNTI